MPVYPEQFPETSSYDDSIDLLELWNTLWRNKVRIILTCFIGVTAAVVYALLQPRQYTSTASFISISNSSGNKMGTLSGLANLAGISLPIQKGNEIDFEIILNSREFAEKIITRLRLIPIIFEDDYDPETGKLRPKEPGIREKLKELLGFKTPGSSPEKANLEKKFILTSATEILRKDIVVVSKDKKNGLFSVSVTWKDPDLAAVIANTYLDELEKYLQRNNLTSTKKSRLFIESQLAKSEEKLKEFEEKIKVFSETYGIFSLEDQASEISEAIGKVRGEIVLEEVKLEVLSEFKGEDNPDVLLAKLKLDALNKRLKELEKGIPQSGKKSVSEIAMRDLPALGLEFGRLKRELAIQQEIYKMLRTQLETTKIEEAKDSETIQVIDHAIPAQFPSKPKRKQIVYIGGIFSLIFAVSCVFLWEFIKKLRAEYTIRAIEKNTNIGSESD